MGEADDWLIFTDAELWSDDVPRLFAPQAKTEWSSGIEKHEGELKSELNRTAEAG